MKTLEEAWCWYSDIKKTSNRMRRVGERYWDVIPWNEAPWRSDRHFVSLTKEEVTGQAANGLRDLDDLAIVVLFSVFEAIVRGMVLDQIEREDSPDHHPIVGRAIETAKERVREGSFFAVLRCLQGVGRWHDRRNQPGPKVSELGRAWKAK